MTNKIVIFNYENNEVRNVIIKGEPWFVLADICKILNISHIKDTAARLDEDEVGQTEVVDRLGRKQSTNIISESGLYSVILRSDKPQAKPFRRWVTSEVLPSIRKTGGYQIKQSDELREKNVQIREQNARIRTAQLLYKIADKTGTEYKQVLHARITALLTGEYILPLPEVNEHSYTAGEIGERLGVSANKIGRLANAHGLKVAQYGKMFYDKAKTADKQVETWRYYENVIPVLQSLLATEAEI